MTQKKTGHEEPEHWELTELPVAPAGANPADADLQKIIRKNYREPILEDDTVYAKIDGLTHRVSDIGSSGLGLIIPTLGTFQAGAPYSLTLHLGTDTLALRGKVTHLSPCETSDKYHCGIEFTDLSQKDAQALQHFLTAHHAKIFDKTSRPAGPGRN